MPPYTLEPDSFYYACIMALQQCFEAAYPLYGFITAHFDWADWWRNGQFIGVHWATLTHIARRLQLLVPEMELLPDLVRIITLVTFIEVTMLGLNMFRAVISLLPLLGG